MAGRGVSASPAAMTGPRQRPADTRPPTTGHRPDWGPDSKFTKSGKHLTQRPAPLLLLHLPEPGPGRGLPQPPRHQPLTFLSSTCPQPMAEAPGGRAFFVEFHA